MILLFSNAFLANEAFLAWERRPVVLEKNKTYQTAIVLTGFTGSRKMTPGRVYFNKGADRLLHTVELYQAGRIKTILISGGSGSLTNRKISEAQQVRKAFIYCGIPDSSILTEDHSSNTAQNAQMSKILIDSIGLKGNFLLVTSAFHMRRAELCFRKVGLKFDIYPVDLYSRERRYTPDILLIPSEDALEKWSILIHEMAGYVIYWIMGYA